MTTRSQIEQAFIATKADKVYTHGYHRFYAEVFKETPDSILEVGIQTGRSLAAWRLLFPNCKISGVDITDEKFLPELLEYANANIYIHDSTESSISEIVEGKYDVIIDDGSHFYKDICKTFYNLRNSFKKFYVIEDALYKQEFIVKYIKRLGFKAVKVYDSNLKNVLVTKYFCTHRPQDNGIPERVDLKFIIILPQPNQT